LAKQAWSITFSLWDEVDNPEQARLSHLAPSSKKAAYINLFYRQECFTVDDDDDDEHY